MVYPLSFIQGIGLIIMINTATSLISDVVGDDTENSAFVYAMYSLFDKISAATILFVVIKEYSEGQPTALKWCVALIPIIGSGCALFLCYIGDKFYSHKLARQITGVKNKRKKKGNKKGNFLEDDSPNIQARGSNPMILKKGSTIIK